MVERPRDERNHDTFEELIRARMAKHRYQMSLERMTKAWQFRTL